MLERVYMIYEEKESVAQLSRHLQRWGIQLLEVSSLDECIKQGDQGHNNSVTLLRAETASLFLVISQLRQSFPVAGILVLQALSENDLRIGHVLLSGADSSMDISVPIPVIVSAIQALQRRGQAFKSWASQQSSALDSNVSVPGSASSSLTTAFGEKLSSRPWQLLDDGWSLCAPDKSTFRLTRGERFVLQALISSAPEPVDRKDLAPEHDSTGRAVDVLISRLRRKVGRIGEDLPIRSVRGEGYVFVGAGSN
ncbi:winged helix-turn-helix domain-containing protein [Alcaligenes endophyticus]|uniref:Winged helix-turn-helix domain-containing protein n=1 Tax=Alcaligenes endophyticus TaxID=1929088 RepID=A0ABT8EG97_9BURK|nr:winged helix-turn-helix domain-containing protein [Alcaligenes endophyticus]MCX5590049.1 winged helix-turn-helix domain-containing protein [Alcaligenes endophyticus]MDN4120288.1 winged helix-turn-helix domain-containing protein [Alcaligenes endophyticus]